MDNEPYRLLTHTQALTFLAEAFHEKHYRVATELTLPNKRRADLFLVNPFGYYEIIEVKTSLSNAVLSEALYKYGAWCNALHLAIPGLTDTSSYALDRVPRWQHHLDRIGLIGVYPESYVQQRPAQKQNLHPRICEILDALLDRRAG